MVRTAAAKESEGLVKLLVSQPYGLGNAICTTPLIQALVKLEERGRTAHEVHVAGDPNRQAACTVLRECPGVKGFLAASDLQAVRKKRFDLLVMCGDEPALTRSYGIPRVDTPFLARGRAERHEDWYKRWTRPEYDVLFDAARRLGWQTEPPSPKLPLPAGPPVKLEMPRPLLALGIGYHKGDERSRKKHMGTHNFARIAWQFQKDTPGTALLVGDKADQEATGGWLVAGTSTIVSLCGRLGFKAMLSVLSQVDAYIGNDTGLSHAAGVLGIPTCVVFRKDASSPVKSKPWGPKVSALLDGGSLAALGWLWNILRKQCTS